MLGGKGEVDDGEGESKPGTTEAGGKEAEAAGEGEGDAGWSGFKAADDGVKMQPSWLPNNRLEKRIRNPMG